jgi:hypothetical protein
MLYTARCIMFYTYSFTGYPRDFYSNWHPFVQLLRSSIWLLIENVLLLIYLNFIYHAYILDVIFTVWIRIPFDNADMKAKLMTILKRIQQIMSLEVVLNFEKIRICSILTAQIITKSIETTI